MTALKIAVFGDRFMKPEIFSEALRRLDADLAITAHELPWPDEPMVHAYGLRECVGDPEALAPLLAEAEILVNHVAPVTAAMLDRAPYLKLIAVSRGGPVNIDVGAAAERGVKVVNAPGRNATAVAEFTIGVILAQTRLITAGHDALRRGEWRGDLYRADMTGEELCDMTVGLIGYGHVGSKIPPLLRPFGCRILVCDPYVDIPPADGVEQVDIETLYHSSDIVSCHQRVTAETTGMHDAAAFARMKPGAYFINTARGPLVDYRALHDALASGRLRGAALECFDREPPDAASPLLRLGNVTLTPHIAGASLRTVRRAADMVAEEVRRYLAGEPALNPA
ncbi:MAG TPA: 2-hydroxyacid dehydrogenase [Stellaceae bacterium]|nr:2-hydroxyacid dehydrogenase [Stellaceae bacterium]